MPVFVNTSIERGICVAEVINRTGGVIFRESSIFFVNVPFSCVFLLWFSLIIFSAGIPICVSCSQTKSASFSACLFLRTLLLPPVTIILLI